MSNDTPDGRKTKGRSGAFDRALGVRLRLLRMSKKVSQSELADALEITFQQIQKYELGTNRMSAASVAKTAEYLDVPVSYFFGTTLSDKKAHRARTRQFILAIEEACLILKGANQNVASVLRDMDELKSQLIPFSEDELGEED